MTRRLFIARSMRNYDVLVGLIRCRCRISIPGIDREPSRNPVCTGGYDAVSAARARTVGGVVVLTLASLTLGCASLFVDAGDYFDDTVVGALEITVSGRFSGFTILDSVAGD